MKSMAALWDDVGFLAGQSKAKAERFETDRTLVVVVWRVVR